MINNQLSSLCDDYGSSSSESNSSDSESVKKNTSTTQQETTTATSIKKEKTQPTIKLPTALDLLSSNTSPSYQLSKKRKGELHEVPVITNKISEKDSKSQQDTFNKEIQVFPSTAQDTKENNDTSQKRGKLNPSNQKEVVNRQGSVSKIPMNKRKERVKEQRMKGQSGIGEGFKVWRSETEMRMRQQFD